ncbi:MAG TPA: inositol monophosphatase [Candidatus Paceibacterota bacterium]|nr:inositol monophosphatase [Candidatus Paceibacterota bacterium]
MDETKLKELEAQVSVIIKKHGSELLKVWQDRKVVELKDAKEPFTEFDVKTEEGVRKELSALLPEAGFLVEEGEDDVKEEYNWAIDPIDQTKNFIGALPLFYVQVALVYKDTPVLGVIYNPVSDQLFSASERNGAKVNGKLVTLDSKKSLSESIIDIDLGGYGENGDWKLDNFNKLMRSAYRIRCTGASFFPYIVTEVIEGYVVLGQRVKITDLMPRIILATELGLKFEQIKSEDRTISIIASEKVVEEIKNILS